MLPPNPRYPKLHRSDWCYLQERPARGAKPCVGADDSLVDIGGSVMLTANSGFLLTGCHYGQQHQ